MDRPPLGETVQLPRNFRIETEFQMQLLLHGGVPPAGARI